MDPITDRDITRQVLRALEDDGTGHDVDAITQAIIDAHGRVDIDTIEPDDFWAVVAAHEQPDPAERFTTEILALADAQESSGQEVTWTGERATVTISGGYVQDTPGGRIAITTPDGRQTRVTGADTWAQVWERVEDAGQQWEVATGHGLAAAVRAQRTVARVERDLAQARVRRDAAVRAAHGQGVSAYRIAKDIGVSEAHVGRIVKR